MALALAAGAQPAEAAVLANHAAGVVVGKLGTAEASATEVLGAFERGRAPVRTVRPRRA
jgi:D-beta-D-heptose 7-phosphate kinase/D-beta-D-heptose 1-phosphate adenosyltransferase